jgi:GH15 family glucan-1,4-alpha-glucosidase
MSTTPIGDHALLSDCHSAALVDRWGSIEWWCLPRFEGPSVFARLLDDDAGHFSVTLDRAHTSRRRYLDSTLTVETTLRSDHGEVVLTDTLAMAPGVRGHDLGKESPHLLVRSVLCTGGQATVAVEFRPRFEYGLTVPLMTGVEGGAVARGGPVTLVLSATAPLDIGEGVATGTVRLSAGDEIHLAVQSASSWKELPEVLSAGEMTEALENTDQAWRSWEDEHQGYDGPFADWVGLSGRILQGLTFVPTGAIVAAPTTSLPETVGGSRNWDYRYAWVRDASFTLDALWVAACPDEEHHFFQFLATAASSVHHRRQLQIMFGIGGERDLTERELPWLDGWRSSSPVRVGNGAWNQSQHDVYGELLAAAHRLHHLLDPLDKPLRRLLVTLAEIAATVWKQPDHGIWEMREEPRHYLYSKLMCWLALDRAIDMAEPLQADDRVEVWAKTREELEDAILADGWNETVGAFTQSFGSSALDASALVIPIVGFLPATDSRVISTIEAIEAQLVDASGLVHRYKSADGLPGEEGAFVLCSFWLAHALALAGRTQRARETFRLTVGFANDLGLLAEEIDPRTGELLGNFPQAFSHIGLINAAWAIDRAERNR